MEPDERLHVWEFDALAPGHAYSLASSSDRSTSSTPTFSSAEVQVNQSEYIPASVLEPFEPEGHKELPEGVVYERDEEHLWSFGKVEGVIAAEMQQLREVLVNRKSAFAYSMKELPGYNGPPAEFQMVPIECPCFP
jgi:hypothetical protein